MARSRVLSAKFFTDGELYDAEQASGLPLRLAYEGMWCAADREGRFEWKPRELKLHVLPYDPVDFAAVLDALEEHGFIESYEVDGQHYGFIPKFKRYQRIHPREAPSILPPPPENGKPKASPGRSEGVPKASPSPSKATPRCPASTSTSASTSASTSTSEGSPAPNGARPFPSWPAEWSRVYGDHVGHMAPGRIGKSCKPVREKYGPERSLEMWVTYCRVRRHFRFGEFKPEHNEITATTPEDFAKTAKFWHEYTEPIGATA